MKYNNEKPIKVIRLDVPELNSQSITYGCANCSEQSACYNHSGFSQPNKVINMRQLEINKMVNEISSLVKRDE